jgi:hypothetical protein
VRVRRLIVLAVAATLACSQPRDERPFVLRIAAVGPFARVHPSVGETHATLAQDLVFAPILFPGANGRPQSRIAGAIEWQGPSRCRIRVSPDARFSDGSAIEFADVARAAAVAGVSATRDGDWIVLDASSALAARLYFAGVYREEGERVLGTGPFRVVEETPWRIVLERVHPVRGRIARVELIGVPTTRDALARTLRGETNAVIGLSDRQAEFLDGVPALNVVRAPGPHSRAIVFSPDRLTAEEMSALRRALPVGEIAARACTQPDDSAAPDPGTLGEIPPGRPLQIGAWGIDERTPLAALALRRALGPRGGSIEPVNLSDPKPSRFVGDMTVRNLLTWPPAVLALTWTADGPMNFTRYSNPAVDAAFARGDEDVAAREIARTAPFVPLCRTERIGAFDVRISNARFGWWGVLDTLPDWEVAP